MKILYWTLGLLVLAAVLLFGLQFAASERVEVVQLHTLDEMGEEVTTRLWIVDDAGFQYLRSGDTTSGWAARTLSETGFELTRNGSRARYMAVPRADKRDSINALMQAKYTWGDRVIAALVGDRDVSVPLELHPAN